ncbi:SWIM zinc finger family protein [Streptomyces viridiviolaceus]|uniref:SWIM zinc finger family protein n=1 Tax=Streptomyces viridiviolaceus TaxID=68282 RepID=A0ABW2DYP5_9ACTN|nr:SWIM zinc finger family protein [Streptomyces viridiviolaceus]
MGDGRGARPADVAREALRAARQEARQPRTDSAGRQAGGARRPARTSSSPRAGTRVADARVRELGELLADAFRLPSDTDSAADIPAVEQAPSVTSAGVEGASSLAGPARVEGGSSAAGPVGAGGASSVAGSTGAEGVWSAAGPAHVEGVSSAAGPVGVDGASSVAGSTSAEGALSAGGPARVEGSSSAAVPAGVEGASSATVPTHAEGASSAAGPARAVDPSSSVGPARAVDPFSSPAPVRTAGASSAAASAHGADPSPEAESPADPPLAAPLPGRPSSPSHPPRSATPRRQSPAVPHRHASKAEPAPPRAPRSMAAPGRDGELRRTFPAFPPRSGEDSGIAETWWGNAWVTALEEGALDPQRLARGRGYAGRGHVDAITVTPGLVLAYVQGSRPRPYRVQVRLRTLDDADWERFLDAAAERPGHIAALLDKELPHSLADCGVPLLPGPGDLAPQCSCPDSGHPCKHAAALCYQTARLLDADPFVLLLLRGRGERELLDALSRLSAARAARAAQDKGPEPLPGVRAGEALTPRSLPPLPAPLPAPPHPEQPPAYPAAPGGPDPFALDQLATDAAARAHALLTTGRDPVGGLTFWQDAVRLAAARPGSGLTAGSRALYTSLASAAGRTTTELARAVAAWRQGGLEGLNALEESWDPPAGRFDRARPLLLAADLPAFRPWRNRLTHPQGHVQLRLGRTGLWYAYESEPGREDWWPRGTPDLDPVGALTGLDTPGGL